MIIKKKKKKFREREKNTHQKLQQTTEELWMRLCGEKSIVRVQSCTLGAFCVDRNKK